MPTEVISQAQAALPQANTHVEVSHKPADVKISTKPADIKSVKPAFEITNVKLISNE